MKIESFQGEHRWLSNFWPAKVLLDGVAYPSVEHAYVAAKTDDLEMRMPIPGMTPGEAKRYGRTLALRADWDDVKLQVMEHLVRQKFQRPDLAAKLRATAGVELVEGNTWGDVFWGVCKDKGKNHLGQILMKVRSEL